MAGPRTHGEQLGLPMRPFMYTIDQVATLLGYDNERQVHDAHLLFYTNRSTGLPSMDELKAVDIARPGNNPEWRVSERELVRWLKRKGFRVHEPRWLN